MFKIKRIDDIESHIIGGWLNTKIKGLPSYSASRMIVVKYQLNGIEYVEIPFSQEDYIYLRNLLEAGADMKYANVRDTILG